MHVGKDDLDDGMFEHAGASTSQQSNNWPSRQHKRERERERRGRKERKKERKEARVRRKWSEKGRRKELVRKPGRKKEDRQVEEEEDKEVEKNVTGWTLVTRSAVAMGVSPEDKVQKILNTVSGSDWDVYVMCEGRILRKK